MAGANDHEFDPVAATVEVAQAFVEGAIAPSALVARNGHVICVSGVTADLLHSAADSFAGRDLVEFVAPDARDAVRELLRTATATGTPRSADVEILSQGLRAQTQLAVFPVLTPAGFVAAHVVTATLQTPADRDLSAPDRIAQVRSAMTGFSSDALHLTSVRSVERAAVRAAASAFDTGNVAIFHVHRTHLRLQRGPDTPTVWANVRPEHRSARTLPTETVRTGRSAFVTDLTADDHTPSSWLTGFRSVAIALIRVHDRIVGGIIAADERPQRFSAADLSALEEFAEIVGVARERLAHPEPTASTPQQLTLPAPPSTFGTWAWNPVNDRYWLSPEAEVLLGLAPGTFDGTRAALDALLGLRPGTDGQRTRETLALMIASGTQGTRFVDTHGNSRWIEVRGHAIDADDPDSEWVGVVYDITERNDLVAARLAAEEATRAANLNVVRLELESRAASGRIQHLIADAPVGFGFWDHELRCLTANRQLADALGRTVAEVIGRTIQEHSPHQSEGLTAAFAAVLEHGTPIEHLVVSGQPRSDPHHRHTWVYKVFPTHLDEAVTGVGAIVVDITEQKRSEQVERLLRSVTEVFVADAASANELLRRAAALAIPDFADFTAVAFRDPTLGTLRGYSTRPNPTGGRHEAVAMTIPDVALVFGNDQTGSAGTRPARLADPVHDAPLLSQFNLQSAVVAPLVVDGTVRGRLVLGFSGTAARAYEPRDLRLAEEIAYRFSDALESQRLRDIATEATSRLELLARLGELTTRAVMSSDDLGALTDAFIPQFCDGAFLMVVEGDVLQRGAASLGGRASQAWADEHWNPMVPLTADTPAANCLRTGQAVLISTSDMREHPDRYHKDAHTTFEHYPFDTGIAIPLIAEHGPVGVVLCSRGAARPRFDDGDIALAPELALRIVPLLEAGIRLRRAQEHTEALQRSLLPQRLPEPFGFGLAARYRAAESGLSVGGDWYDALDLPDRSVLLVIGDVVGHGAFAAGLTGQLRTALRLAVLDTSDVSVLLTRLDRFLADLADLELATALLVRIDRDTGELTWASAGHPPPILRGPGGSTTLLPTRPGPPLGCSLGLAFPFNTTTLERGSCVLLYTDGLVERRGEIIDLGLTRLADVVQASEPDVEHLDACALGLMDAMLPDATPADDVALLLAHRFEDVVTFRLDISNDPTAVRTARHSLIDFLAVNHITGPDTENLALITSELCANAMEHSDSEPGLPIRIRLAASPRGAELTVEDNGIWVTSGPRRGGRGLQIVRSLCDSVDITRMPSGTRVTVRCTFAGRPEPIPV